MGTVTAERVRALFRYNRRTGELIRRTTVGGALAGSVAGNVQRDGRVQLYIDGRNYKAHRVIWLLITGAWPRYEIDHRDGDQSNNRWRNLRDVPHRVNIENRRGPTRANPHGLAGVTMNHRRFMAQIKVDGKRMYLGTFDTAEQAHAVYLEAKRLHHSGCTV